MTNFGEMMRRARQDAEEGDWSPGPGTHDAIVESGDAFESNAGDAYAKTVLKLVKPGHPDDGRTWDHLMGFRSPQQAQMSAGQLSLYGVPGDVLDDLEDIDDLARHMAELEGVHVQVSCKSRANGDGVWTNILGSRNPNASDIPVEQGAFSLGDGRAKPAPPANAVTGPADDEPIPF